MKKDLFLLAALVMLSLTTVRAQVQANIYASGLQASAVAANGDVQFTYTLNADASSVTIHVSNGDQFPVTTADDLLKGPHTVTKRLSVGTTVDDYTWSIQATGVTANTNAGQNPVKVSDASASFVFATPRGVAVDSDPQSSFFGNIYVSESSNSTQGIYKLDASLTTKSSAYTGGISWYTTAASPYHLSIAPNGDVVICDWSDSENTGVYLMNPANPSSFTRVFGGTPTASNGLLSGVHGSIPYAYIFGTGANRKLYTTDEDFQTRNILCYNIGELTSPWTSAPSAVVYDNANSTTTPRLINATVGLAPDGRGNWWLTQYRATETSTEPSLIHVQSDNNVIDYRSSALPAMIGSVQRAIITTNSDGSLLAIVGGALTTIKIYAVSFDVSNVPSLTLKYTIASALTADIYGLAFDAVNNLYAVATGGLGVWTLPTTAVANTFTTPAPASQPVEVTQTIVTQEEKTFTVTVPNGTEHVYIAGDFTGKSWDIADPYELTPTGNPNEFSGSFPCTDGVEYKYLCEEGDWDYQEGVDGGPDQPAVERPTNRVIASGTSTTDVIPYWYNVKKIKFEVTFGAGVTVPSNLSVHVGPNNWSTSVDVALTKSGNKYTGSYGGNTGDKFRTNTQYKYFIPTATPVWENSNDRWAIAPGMNDVITAFQGAPISGTYYIPDNSQNQGWNSLAAAFDDINTIGISGDVTLLVNGDITSGVNVGLINDSEHSITIRPDADVDRTINFTSTADNSVASGHWLLGYGGTLNVATNAASVIPARNITIDGYASGSATHKMKITNAADDLSKGAQLITIVGACENVTIKNCILENKSTYSGATAYLIPRCVYIQSYNDLVTSNVTIEGNELLTNTTAAQGNAIRVSTWTGTPTTTHSNFVVRNNKLTSRSHTLYLAYLNGVNIEGNEFHTVNTPTGTVTYCIYPSGGVVGDVYVQKNRFIELTTANTAANTVDGGIKCMTTGNPGATWYIENNYFTGFDKLSATGTAATFNPIRVATNSYIRHNTFYFNTLTNPASGNNVTPAVAEPMYCAINVAAGTATVENNLFAVAETVTPTFFSRGGITANNNVFAIVSSNTNAKLTSTGTITGTNVTIEEVTFADAPTGNLDIAGVSIKDENLGVTPLAEVPYDIYGTSRNATLTYAGAYESEPFDSVGTGVEAVTSGNVRIVSEGAQLTITALSGDRIQSVKLYDLQGRLITSEQSIPANVYSIATPEKGVYIVETVIDGARNVQKIAIR